jgi:hypothetical protein
MSGVTLDLIKSTSQKLQAMKPKISIAGTQPSSPRLSTLTLTLAGKLPPPETQEEINKLQSALAFLSPDVGRGHGSFYDSRGLPENDYWLACVWAIASLNWQSGESTARNWSQQSNRYTDDGFNQAWNGYKPNHTNAIGIGSLYKKAMDLGWQQLAVQATSSPKALSSNNNNEPARFPLLSLDDLDGLQPNEWLVKNVLPTKGLAAIFGPSGSGKTFVVVDLLMAIACKPAWFGFKVKNVPVVYIGLEGKSGIPRRFKAWHKKNSQLYPSNVKVVLSNFNVLARNQIEELADTIQQVNMTSGVIVIDTLNQASPGSDENSSQDMGIIISHLKMLQELTGSLVLIIHHTGKNTAAGLRGHSSLKAALDTSIEVIGGDNRSWLLEKNKDGADGQSFPFKLEVQTLGIDADGESITSCTIERNTNVIFQKPEPSGKAQKAAYKLIKQTLVLSSDFNKCNSGIQTACIKVEDAVTKLASTLTTEASNKRSNRARTIISSLTQGGYLSTGLELDEGWIWLP